MMAPTMGSKSQHDSSADLPILEPDPIHPYGTTRMVGSVTLGDSIERFKGEGLMEDLTILMGDMVDYDHVFSNSDSDLSDWSNALDDVSPLHESDEDVFETVRHDAAKVNEEQKRDDFAYLGNSAQPIDARPMEMRDANIGVGFDGQNILFQPSPNTQPQLMYGRTSASTHARLMQPMPDAQQVNKRNLKRPPPESSPSTTLEADRPDSDPIEPAAKKTKHPETSKTKKKKRNYPNRGYNDLGWDERYQELVQYKREHGDCQVPYKYEQNQPLAQWVKRQRFQYKLLKDGERSTMTPGRQRTLEALGFVWNKHDASWNERFQDFRKFVRENGHCRVPATGMEHRQLSLWIKTQRRQYRDMVGGRKSTMTPARIEHMEQLGFKFDVKATEQAKASEFKSSDDDTENDGDDKNDDEDDENDEDETSDRKPSPSRTQKL